MTLVRWSPRMVRRPQEREGGNWMTEWDNWFDEFFGRSPATSCDWMPPLDVREEDKHYRVLVDLPGMKRDDIRVTFENDVLTVTGERKGQGEEKQGKLHRSERFSGKFTRSLRFPSDVEPGKIDAQFKDGVLEISLPKHEGAMVRQIEVK